MGTNLPGRDEAEIRGRYLADDARAAGYREGLLEAIRVIEQRAQLATDPSAKRALLDASEALRAFVGER